MSSIATELQEVARGYGGLVPPEESPGWSSWHVMLAQRAKWWKEITPTPHELTSAGFPNHLSQSVNRLAVGVVNDSELNGFATHGKHGFYALICAGCWDHLFAAFAEALQIPSVRSSPTISQINVGEHSSAPGVDPDLIATGYRIAACTSLACQCILLHEIGHVVCGHVALFGSGSAAKAIDERSTASPLIPHHDFEFDADAFGAGLFSRVLGEGGVWERRLMRDDEHFATVVLFSLGVLSKTLLVLGGPDASDTHPAPVERLYNYGLSMWWPETMLSDNSQETRRTGADVVPTALSLLWAAYPGEPIFPPKDDFASVTAHVYEARARRRSHCLELDARVGVLLASMDRASADVGPPSTHVADSSRPDPRLVALHKYREGATLVLEGIRTNSSAAGCDGLEKLVEAHGCDPTFLEPWKLYCRVSYTRLRGDDLKQFVATERIFASRRPEKARFLDNLVSRDEVESDEQLIADLERVVQSPFP